MQNKNNDKSLLTGLILLSVCLVMFIALILMPDANKSAWPVIVVWGIAVGCFWILFFVKRSRRKQKSGSPNNPDLSSAEPPAEQVREAEPPPADIFQNRQRTVPNNPKKCSCERCGTDLTYDSRFIEIDGKKYCDVCADYMKYLEAAPRKECALCGQVFPVPVMQTILGVKLCKDCLPKYLAGARKGKKEPSDDKTAAAVASAIQSGQKSLKELAAEKDARPEVTERELVQYYADYFMPNTEFYSTPGSEKFKAYFGAITAARDEMLKNPDIFKLATKWDISRLAEMLRNPKPSVTTILVCGLIFRVGDYGVLKSTVYCVDFCEKIPNCIALYLLLTAQKLPEEKRSQTIDAGDRSDPAAFRAALESLRVLDPKWRFVIL